MRKTAKIFAAALAAAVLLWLGTALLLWGCPQCFFYHPRQLPADLKKAAADGYRAEEVRYVSADGTPLYAWFTKPGAKKKIIVFYHGNAYNIEGFYYKLQPLVNAGYGVLLPEYRGFGGIEGKITEPALAADALAAVNYLRGLGYKNSDIILYGMSLGSYTSTHTAAVYGETDPFAALILEVPFDSLANVVRGVVPFLPVDTLVRDRYDNQELINRIETPLLVMIAGRDKTVPPRFGKNLFARASQPKKMIIYEDGNHADLYNHRNYRDILTWLETDEKTR